MYCEDEALHFAPEFQADDDRLEYDLALASAPVLIQVIWIPFVARSIDELIELLLDKPRYARPRTRAPPAARPSRFPRKPLMLVR